MDLQGATSSMIFHDGFNPHKFRTVFWGNANAKICASDSWTCHFLGFDLLEIRLKYLNASNIIQHHPSICRWIHATGASDFCPNFHTFFMKVMRDKLKQPGQGKNLVAGTKECYGCRWVAAGWLR